MNDSTKTQKKRILITGAAGYVGRHLLRRLAETDHTIRCLVRNPQTAAADFPKRVELIKGDVLEPASLEKAIEGIDVAYFLIHSMSAGSDFEEKDRRIAHAFSRSAAQAGVNRIIYLGGLGNDANLSPHLASRQEVGRILRDSGILTIEFRASIIIGAGSISFEMIRGLVHRLPIMVAPRWVRTLAQPIAIDDVIAYLQAGLEVDLDSSTVFEIGGPDRLSYLDLVKEYARQRGLRRIILPVPVLTPWLSSLWLDLVTPLQAQIGRRLIAGVRNESVVNDPAARNHFPIRPRGVKQAIREALESENRDKD
jgi:uncharacterized protein YbjT (DUF2867 family)